MILFLSFPITRYESDDRFAATPAFEFPRILA
jgi:hypothetical protein